VNNSGSDGYITLLQAVGDAIYPPSVQLREAEDTTSQDDYGPRTLTLDAYWQESSTAAKAIADWLLSELKDPMPIPTVQLENQPDLQFGPDLCESRIHLTVAAKGIDDYFRVGKIEHRWLKENGIAVQTTFKLEPYFTPFS
jgi:hypothetical protein